MDAAKPWHELLRALDPDPVRAAIRYVELRAKLVAQLRRRGLATPEDVVDEAFERVTRRLAEGVALQRSIDAYLYGATRRVACEVYRREQRKRRFEVRMQALAAADEASGDRLADLERCLAQLPSASRDALLFYDGADGRERIERRKALAMRFGIPLNALRIRMHRLRSRVRELLLSAAGPATT